MSRSNLLFINLFSLSYHLSSAQRFEKGEPCMGKNLVFIYEQREGSPRRGAIASSLPVS